LLLPLLAARKSKIKVSADAVVVRALSWLMEHFLLRHHKGGRALIPFWRVPASGPNHLQTPSTGGQILTYTKWGVGHGIHL